MKNVIITNCLNIITKEKPHISEEKIIEIRYGLISIYLVITKLIIILTISYFLNIFKEVIIFTFLYNIIRIPSFGIHANKSYICLTLSIIIFIFIPFISTYISISIYMKSILGIICTLLMFKNAPADTHKRPIINKKKRELYKFISVIITIVYFLLSIFLNNILLSNLLIFSVILQSFIISPFIYKLFKLPYNNYLNYSYGN